MKPETLQVIETLKEFAKAIEKAHGRKKRELRLARNQFMLELNGKTVRNNVVR